MDLVVWGHEHECLIDPRLNHEFQFHVMQPGSSVATSLCPGEAVPKHVAILTVTGKEFKTENIRLKTVRPFVMKEIILNDIPELRPLSEKENHRTELTRYLMSAVEELIQQAKTEWEAVRAANPPDEDDMELEEDKICPLPLIRLRVEHTASDGGRFDCENAQRFSNRFVGKVANITDVVQFHRKKARQTRNKETPDMPDEAVLAAMQISTVKVDKLVKEFLAAQKLVILPQNTFGDAVAQFVDKDDKHAMEIFVNDSLGDQMKHLMDSERPVIDEKEIHRIMDEYRLKLEQLFNKGGKRNFGKRSYKPKPDGWDSEIEGEWEAQPDALIRSGDEGGETQNDEQGEDEAVARPMNGKGTQRASGAKSAAIRKTGGSKADTAKTTKPIPSKTPVGRRKQVQEDDQASEDPVVPDDDSDDFEASNRPSEIISDDEASEEIEEVRPPPKTTARTTRTTAAKPPAPKKAAVAAPKSRTVAATRKPAASKGSTAAGTRQSQLMFSQNTSTPAARKSAVRPPRDEDDDEDDEAFEPVVRSTRKR